MSDEATIVERVVAPLVNPNEPESQVVELGVESFSAVTAGQVICTLETSKSTVDVECEADGFVGRLQVQEFDRVEAGQLICEVFDRMPAADRDVAAAVDAPPADLKMTKKAEALARELGVDLTQLSTDRFVTEREVREIASSTAEAPELDPGLLARIGPRSVAVYGGGGFGRSLLDTIAALEALEVLCIVDDGLPAGSDVLGVPVVGGSAALPGLVDAGLALATNAVGAIGRIQQRVEVTMRLDAAGLSLATAVDTTAALAASAELAPGVLVMPQATVWSSATIGRATIVNTGAIVSHDCHVGEHVHLAPGAILAGHVEVGSESLVGMAVTTRPGLRIGAGAIVGNGAVLTEDVPDGGIVSAGSVWPRAS